MESMKEALIAMLEESHEEMVLMNEDVWLKGEEVVDMVESLKIADACLKEISEAEKNIKISLDNNNHIKIIQIHDDKDGSKNVNVQRGEVVEDNYSYARADYACLGYKYWWEAYALVSGGDNHTEYNWCFEDDMKMWEWSEYEFLQHSDMWGFSGCKDASEA